MSPAYSSTKCLHKPPFWPDPGPTPYLPHVRNQFTPVPSPSGGEQGKPRTLKCFFLANCEEEGLPRRVLGLIHFSPSIEEALMPCPVVFSLEHTVGEDQDKSGPAGLDSETFTLRHSSKLREGTSLPVQCLRLCLPMQGG